MKRIVLGTVTGLLMCATADAQDVPLTQYLTSPLYMNPALTGFSMPDDVRAAANYRSEASATTTDPAITGLLSFDIAALHDKLGGGDVLGMGIIAQYAKSNTGGLQNSTVGFSIAYNRTLDKAHLHRLAAGMQVAMVQKNLTLNRLAEKDFYGNESERPLYVQTADLGNPTLSYTDVNVGLAYAGQYTARLKVMAGYAAYHAVRPEEVFENLKHKVDLRHTAHAGASYYVGKNYLMKANALLQSQSTYTQMIAGASFGIMLNPKDDPAFKKNRVATVGLWYRINKSIAPALMIDWENYHAGASYDINTTGVKNVSGGTFEFSLGYSFRRRPVTDREMEVDYDRGNPILR